VVLRTFWSCAAKVTAGEHGAPAPASTAIEPLEELEELDDEETAAGEPPAPLLLDADELPAPPTPLVVLLEDAGPDTLPPAPDELGEPTPGVPPAPGVPLRVPELAGLPPAPVPPPVPVPAPSGAGPVAHAANPAAPRHTSAPIPQAVKRLTRMRSPFFSTRGAVASLIVSGVSTVAGARRGSSRGG
jgi:hypothetical protein